MIYLVPYIISSYDAFREAYEKFVEERQDKLKNEFLRLIKDY